jgi:hypothetical protein
VRLVLVNTFNHHHAKPRFRAIIPVDRPLTADAHELLFDSIVRKIEDAGFYVDRGLRGPRKANGSPRSGLDWSKRAATSLFNLPSQAADPAQSFFVDFNGPERELLNPLLWIENSIVPLVSRLEPVTRPEPRESVNELLVKEATNEWLRLVILRPPQIDDVFVQRTATTAPVSPR